MQLSATMWYRVGLKAGLLSKWLWEPGLSTQKDSVQCLPYTTPPMNSRGIKIRSKCAKL